jgi:tetratricopeptide (TPR) repeat protein
VPPFVALSAAPLSLLISDRRTRRGLQAALLILGVPLTVLSGSRSAWIAIAVAAAVLLVPPIIRRVRRRGLAWLGPDTWTPRRVGIAVLGLAVLTLSLTLIAPRLTDLRSLLYRGFLWRDTLAAWSSDPLFGIGPGSMPFARQAAAPSLSFPVRQPHSHDVPLGILGDAGLLGLAAAAAVVITFVWLAGPWRTRTRPGRAAFAVLSGIATSMLFEDLTFLPGFNLLMLTLAAMALTDGGAITWRPLHPPGWQGRGLAAAGVVASAALVAVMAAGDASAIAYRQGTDAASGRDWPAALEAFQASVRLNPWQPTGPKAVALVADRAGKPELARQSTERAVELGPGDGSAWTNLAVLCRAQGDRECARRAADRAVDTASPSGQELANAALTYEWLGDRQAADRAYRFSLLTNPYTSLTLPWPRPVSVGDGTAPELGVDVAELSLLIARRVANEDIDPDAYATPVIRALAYAMTGDRPAAEDEVQRALTAMPESPTGWEVAALLARHYGQDAERFLRIGDAARGIQLASGTPEQPALVYDIATFRAYPADGLVADAVRLVPSQPWPWVLEPYLAR